MSIRVVAALIVGCGFVGPARAQQFNSDNYVTMPKGVATFLLTFGQRSSTVMGTIALTNSFELNLGLNAYSEKRSEGVSAYYSTVIYGHWKYYQNKSDTGGLSLTFGSGARPGYLERNQISTSGRTYFVATQNTLPLFRNKVSLDFDAGAILDLEYGSTKSRSAGFTHSTRVAVNKAFLKTSIVAEAYGTVGAAYTQPEYKAGLRWEPNDTLVVAATYGQQFRGGRGPGFEAGIMIFTPPFLCWGGCK